MYGWVIIAIIIACAIYMGLRIAKAAGDADKSNALLLLQQSIQEGEIILPECNHAYDCYLFELDLHGKYPDCEKCHTSKIENNLNPQEDNSMNGVSHNTTR